MSVNLENTLVLSLQERNMHHVRMLVTIIKKKEQYHISEAHTSIGKLGTEIYIYLPGATVIAKNKILFRRSVMLREMKQAY